MPEEEERQRAYSRVYVCVCDTRKGEGYERTCFRQRRAKEKDRERERKRWRRRFRFRPSGNRTRSPPFLVFDPRHILPWPPLPSRPNTFSSASSSYTRSTLIPRLFGVSCLAVLTLSVYTYYAKRVTVGGLGSQTRTV